MFIKTVKLNYKKEIDVQFSYFYYYIQIFYSNDTNNNLKVYWVLHDSLISLV